MYKYKTFDDYFWEAESYATRGERLYDESPQLNYAAQKRLVEWLQAAWQCAREEKDEQGPT